MYDEIKADPAQEKKYFRRCTSTTGTGRSAASSSRWSTGLIRARSGSASRWRSSRPGRLSEHQGAIQWDGHVFQPTDRPDAAVEARPWHEEGRRDVANAPAGWTPDKTFVKRQVHFTEPPSDDENPFARVSVEQNVVDLDPGDYGPARRRHQPRGARRQRRRACASGRSSSTSTLRTPSRSSRSLPGVGKTDDGNEPPAGQVQLEVRRTRPSRATGWSSPASRRSCRRYTVPGRGHRQGQHFQQGRFVAGRIAGGRRERPDPTARSDAERSRRCHAEPPCAGLQPAGAPGPHPAGREDSASASGGRADGHVRLRAHPAGQARILDRQRRRVVGASLGNRARNSGQTRQRRREVDVLGLRHESTARVRRDYGRVRPRPHAASAVLA